MKPLRLHRAARAEIRAAAGHYAAIHPELGRLLYDAMDESSKRRAHVACAVCGLCHQGSRRLDDADQRCIIVCMRTTLNLNDALMEEAGEYAGLKEKTALLHEGLRALIQREAAARLAALGGKDPKAAAAPRRKAGPRR